jgi:spore germination cell wall hydrolase CwlJ-like protein
MTDVTGVPISKGLSSSVFAEPPRPERHVLEPLTREEAIAANAARPPVAGAIERALPFKSGLSLADSTQYAEALNCLTTAVYYEAGGESVRGQKAVAQVVLNRVRHPAFPSTICGVVYQGSELVSGCQFSFTCDGSLATAPSRRGWERARRIAERALAGQVEDSVGLATHFHANWVVPYWAPNLDKIATVGAHVFYRWRGYWGRRRAFSRNYAGEGAQPPRLAYAEDLSASWDKTFSQPTGPSTTKDSPLVVESLTSDRQGLAADQPVRIILADKAKGHLVADDEAAALRGNRSLGPSL